MVPLFFHETFHRFLDRMTALYQRKRELCTKVIHHVYNLSIVQNYGDKYADIKKADFLVDKLSPGNSDLSPKNVDKLKFFLFFLD